MGGQSGIRLIVQGDDFGMCHAVNVGTMRAFRDGILTQTSTLGGPAAVVAVWLRRGL